MKQLLILVLVTAPALLLADGLSDVRATLQKLQSDQPLRARVEIKSRRLGGESDKQKQSQATSIVTVTSGPDGLTVNWAPDQVKQSRKAAWVATANPDLPPSDLATLKAVGGGDALNLLDAADPLRRGLEKAVLQEDKRDTYQGKPARLLVIKVDLGLDEEERKALKSSEAIMKLWLDADGVPLAMERDVRAKFSKLLISFRVHEHETREFQRAGGRLVVTRASKDSSGSGFGHTDEIHSTTTVSLLTD